MLRSFILRLFRGRTEEYCEAFGRQCISSAREDATKYISELVADRDHEREYYQHELDKKNLEIQRLTNLILTEHGVIHPEVPVRESSSPMLPISGRKRWNQTRQELERNDAQKAAEVRADYWKKKNEAAGA